MKPFRRKVGPWMVEGFRAREKSGLPLAGTKGARGAAGLREEPGLWQEGCSVGFWGTAWPRDWAVGTEPLPRCTLREQCPQGKPTCQEERGGSRGGLQFYSSGSCNIFGQVWNGRGREGWIRAEERRAERSKLHGGRAKLPGSFAGFAHLKS